MSLLGLILAITLIGLLVWAINSYVPMAPGVKRILNIAVVVILVIWLLYVFGLLDELRTIRVPRV